MHNLERQRSLTAQHLCLHVKGHASLGISITSARATYPRLWGRRICWVQLCCGCSAGAEALVQTVHRPSCLGGTVLVVEDQTVRDLHLHDWYDWHVLFQRWKRCCLSFPSVMMWVSPGSRQLVNTTANLATEPAAVGTLSRGDVCPGDAINHWIKMTLWHLGLGLKGTWQWIWKACSHLWLSFLGDCRTKTNSTQQPESNLSSSWGWGKKKKKRNEREVKVTATAWF